MPASATYRDVVINELFTDVSPSFGLPQVDFVFSGNCLENPTVFLDNSAIISDSLVDFIWQFGDGVISAGNSTYHNYQMLGNYSVKLIVTSSFGCRDSLIKNVQVLPKPIVDFSYNPLSATIINPIINFSNQSIDAVPTIWDFGCSIIQGCLISQMSALR